jgi:hypothetical protein
LKEFTRKIFKKKNFEYVKNVEDIENNLLKNGESKKRIKVFGFFYDKKELALEIDQFI